MSSCPPSASNSSDQVLCQGAIKPANACPQRNAPAGRVRHHLQPRRRQSLMHLDGALTKRMQAGQAASAGVFSAVLAQTGFTGARNTFNGRFGFLELYQPNGYDASVLLSELGTAFRGEALSHKPYPCGRPLHAAIDAALAARA